MYVRDTYHLVVFNWNGVSCKANAQTINFVTSQFTFGLLESLLYSLF